jgi:hypothetical protein
MQSSGAMPFAAPDDLGWARYRGLQLPPDIARLLGVAPASSFDGHVDNDHVPAEPPSAREISSLESGDAPMASELRVVVDVASPIGDAPQEEAVRVPRAKPRLRRSGPQPDRPVVSGEVGKRARLCGNCKQPGHMRKTCPALGRGPLDSNRNSLSVEALQPPVRRSRVASEDVPHVESRPRVEVANAIGRVSDEEQSHGSVSGSESDEDFTALAGFDDAVWVREFDSALPADDANSCPPPSKERRGRRASSDGQSPASESDGDDAMDGAPACDRDQEKPRARRIPRECKTPLQFVELFIPVSMVHEFVTWTNCAASTHPRLRNQARFANWKPTTNTEMYSFICICVYLGVVKIQNRKVIWRMGGVFGQSWVQQRMSLRRFESLLNAFNCTAHWNMTDEDFAASNAADPFWQVKNYVEECNRRSAYHFKMGRSFSIDEAVIPWKGRHKGRCYNPKKPAKYHFKKFSLNCSATGYVYCHYHYGGKDELRPSNVPASLWPIKKLVDQCPDLHDKNHFCATDNWYTSAQSLAYLRSKGIHCVGTINKKRLGSRFPPAGIFKVARGQPKRARADCCIYSTKVDGHAAFVTSWQDKRPVTVLSSYRPLAGECVRKIKVGRTWTKQRFFRPTVIRHYNHTMGGTDLHDQRLAFARSTVKSRRWQVRVCSLLHVSLLLICACDSRECCSI